MIWEAALVVVNTWPLDGLLHWRLRCKPGPKQDIRPFLITLRPWPLSLLPPPFHRQIREVRSRGWVTPVSHLRHSVPSQSLSSGINRIVSD